VPGGSVGRDAYPSVRQGELVGIGTGRRHCYLDAVQVAATEDVERLIAVAIIVTVEEAPLLAAVQKSSLASRSMTISRGRVAWASKNSSTNSRSIAALSWLIL